MPESLKSELNARYLAWLASEIDDQELAYSFALIVEKFIDRTEREARAQ